MIKKEYGILLNFVKQPWKKFTFKDIKKLSKKKSEGYVYNSLKEFVKQGILNEEKVGNVILYCLNIKSLKALAYAGFVLEYYSWNQSHIPYSDLQRVADKIPTDFYIFLITGSYAHKTQKENSDIDIVVIIDDSADPKKAYAQLRMACELSIPEMHLYVFKKTEFLGMLLNKEANYGKEIVKNNLILSGAENYYKIISEAIENGFNGV